MVGDCMGPGIGNNSSKNKKFKLSVSALSSAPLDKTRLEGNHLLVKSLLSTPGLPTEVYALVDCGASHFAFIDEDFTCQHNLSLYELKTPQALEVIDGHPILSGDITHIVKSL